jgi:uncharacterized membrane protein
MAETLLLLARTVAYRPYVFAFLAAYLLAAGLALGARRVACLTGIVWVTAFVAEYSSTRTGIPFGLYTYLENTRDRELYLANVPFMDSLSFTFLAFAAYATALTLLAPVKRSAAGRAVPWRLPQPVVDDRLARSPAVLLLAAALFTLIDVIIDPLALRGDRWFLGPIYTYPHGGLYFGVPLSNFVGWFAVGVVGLGLYLAADARLTRRGNRRPIRGEGLVLGVGLYYAVLAFNLTMTFAIGEPLIGMIGCLVCGVPTLLLASRLGRGSGR